MKSQSWIEVLITLAVFLYIIVYMYQDIVNGLSQYSTGLYKISEYQKLYTSSFYFSQFYDPQIVYNYTNFSFSYYYTPDVIFLSTNPFICNNCIEFFYNMSSNSIEIIQNSNINVSSILQVYIYGTTQNINITNNSAYYNCDNYLSSSFFSVYTRTFLYCNFNLIGNSSIYINTNEKFLIINNYNTVLYLYNGDKIVGLPNILMNIYPTVYLNYFQYFNGSINYISLYG
ncbi:MAG: hypothetical protein L7G81_00495 [Candidatus Nanopusillus sp.]|nr:hypothetical protein [Candidatus Nanopusillus sp.]